MLDILVVSEFAYVFPKEVPDVLPVRDVEFRINVSLSIMHISRVLDQMALLEQELKT